MRTNRGLFIVDAQNDFMGLDDGTAYTVKHSLGADPHMAALPVKGGLAAAKNIVHHIDVDRRGISHVWKSEDCHESDQLAHPINWVDVRGEPPKPFTQIPLAQVLDGTWRLANDDERLFDAVIKYLTTLESTSDMVLTIWPPHCIKKSWGQHTVADIDRALERWERIHDSFVSTIYKGMAIVEEHYGAIEAQVQNPAIPSTMPSQELLDALKVCDELVVVGVATDYCVRRTVEQMLKYLGVEFAQKLVILTDCIAGIDPVVSEAFLQKMRSLGAQVTTSQDYRIPSSS